MGKGDKSAENLHCERLALFFPGSPEKRYTVKEAMALLLKNKLYRP